MSTNLWDLFPIPLQDDKPSNRGRFSDDRQYWEEVHKRRYLQWQSGDGIEQIAASEGVTYNAVKHSLLWCEARLSHAEVLAAHQTRLRLQAFGRLSTRYLDELESLMSDPNPVIRARALEAFRRTVGLEMSGGVNVNVSQRTTVSNGHPSSFEEVMEHVRAKTYSRAPRAKPTRGARKLSWSAGVGHRIRKSLSEFFGQTPPWAGCRLAFDGTKRGGAVPFKYCEARPFSTEQGWPSREVLLSRWPVGGQMFFLTAPFIEPAVDFPGAVDHGQRAGGGFKTEKFHLKRWSADCTWGFNGSIRATSLYCSMDLSRSPRAS